MKKFAFIILGILAFAAVGFGMLGTRGQISANRPWHLFLDMKYQARYTGQGQSAYWADGRSMRTPVEGAIPYAGMVYANDAGYVPGPNEDMLPEADPVYYFGQTSLTKKKVQEEVEEEVEKKDKDGVPMKDKDGKPVKEKVKKKVDKEVTDWTEKIPAKAIEKFGYAPTDTSEIKWSRLVARGQERFNIHCVACHGQTGFGGQGEAAHGTVGRRGMVGIASYHQERLRENKMADGEIFGTITYGKNSMSSYGHQIPVLDRWAIVAYVRVLQLSQNAPEAMVDPIKRSTLQGGAK